MGIRISAVATALVLAAGSAAMARGGFTPGNLVVSQVGNGSAGLASTGTPAFLQEFTLVGVSVGSTPLPTSASGANRQFTLSGTATSEGFLTLSTDRRYLTMAGYDGAVGSAITGTNSSVTNRVIARIDSAGLTDTTTALADNISPGNPRSVCSDDGSNFWVGTSAAGVRWAGYGSNASTQLSTTITNTRVTNLFNGQLYTSSATGAFQGVSTVGSGSPTTSGQTITLLPGFPTAAGPSSYDYFFSDASTLYVGDDRTNGSGGIQKWVFGAGSWSLSYTMAVNATTGIRGLCGAVNPSTGAVTLYGTTAIAASSGNALVSVTDIGAGSAFATLATAATNTAFRGVDFTPVPAPGTLGLIGIAGLLAARRRR